MFNTLLGGETQYFDVVIDISGNGFNVNDAIVALGYQGGLASVNVTINAEDEEMEPIIVGSPSSAFPAIDIGPLGPGSTVRIINNGRIQGRGGDGGQGGANLGNGVPGAVGGTAILVPELLDEDEELLGVISVAITNNASIWAGGGGGGGGQGGGGAGCSAGCGGGGGGGAGTVGGLGGQPGTVNCGLFPSGPGAAGTAEAGGVGGAGQNSNNGGTGGLPGFAGQPGVANCPSGVLPGAGGAAGFYVESNGNPVVFNLTGDVRGRLS
jgi:hypothetical protein